MFNFFRQVISFIEMLIDFIVQLVTGLITLLTLIPQGLGFLFQIITNIPPILQVFALAAVSISVIFLIIGRTGKSG